MANLILAIDLAEGSHPLIHSEGQGFCLAIELKRDFSKSTHTQERYRQRKVRWKNFFEKTKGDPPRIFVGVSGREGTVQIIQRSNNVHNNRVVQLLYGFHIVNVSTIWIPYRWAVLLLQGAYSCTEWLYLVVVLLSDLAEVSFCQVG